MTRVTAADVRRRVGRLQGAGMPIDVEFAMGKVRVTNDTGDRNLSGMLSKREALDWLASYEEGWDAARRAVEKQNVG